MQGKEALLLLLASAATTGCASPTLQAPPRPSTMMKAVGPDGSRPTAPQRPMARRSAKPASDVAPARAAQPEPIQLVQHQEPLPEPAASSATGDTKSGKENAVSPELVETPAAVLPATVTLDDVLRSLEANYPLLAASYEARRIAAGAQLAAKGNFDTKLRAYSELQPLGDYENYRNAAYLTQPTYWGGEVYGGYRIARGEFEPGLENLATNEGGEFSAGFSVPLAQNKWIDERRAEVWRTGVERHLAEFNIQADRIDFRLAAENSYWDWLAAGQLYRINENLLKLAQDRVELLEKQVAAEQVAQITLVDNQRLIVSREAKLIESRQKLQQAAIKLSLFYREPSGRPIVPELSQMPEELPAPDPVDEAQVTNDIQLALNARPEPRQYMLARRQFQIDYDQARNEVLPEVNASLGGSQDVGKRAKSEDNKDDLKLEAGLTLDVPLQRRKALGKIRALEGKLAQNLAKLRYAEDKIVTEVQAANTSISAAYEQYQRARESVSLNQQLEDAERKRMEAQRSNLLIVNLREQATADASTAEITAWQQYFQALSFRRAAIGLEAAQPQLTAK